MWKSRRNVIIAVLLAVVVLAGVSGGIVLAQDGDGGQFHKPGALFARVAEILGIDQQKMDDAVKQAMDEFKAANPRPERPVINHNELMDRLVADGKITQEQADQLKAWWEAKPSNLKENAQAFKDWMESRPDVPMPKPEGGRFMPGMRPGR